MPIDGINFDRNGNCAICHIEHLSDDLKTIIRANLATICHGTHISDYDGEPLFDYKATLGSLLDRYKTKTKETQMGMIGELLSHILITQLFDEYDIASPFFNLEEKSIKKGFDLILYKPSDGSAWITEVKSGKLHKGKDHEETTHDLLSTAKGDLKKRLNQQKKMHWLNAIHSVKTSLNDEADYKKTLVNILVKEGSSAAQGKAVGSDNYVVLISNLFEPLDKKITINPAESVLESIQKVKTELFKDTVVFSIQKETYSAVAEFLQLEATGMEES